MVEGLTSSQHLTRGQRAGTDWVSLADRDPRSTGAGVANCDDRRCRHLPDAHNPGDSSGEATPVPIPNTEVKLSSAEDTERAAFRENRSSPGLLHLRRVCLTSRIDSLKVSLNAHLDEWAYPHLDDRHRRRAPQPRAPGRTASADGPTPHRGRAPGVPVPQGRGRRLAEPLPDTRPPVRRHAARRGAVVGKQREMCLRPAHDDLRHLPGGARARERARSPTRASMPDSGRPPSSRCSPSSPPGRPRDRCRRARRAPAARRSWPG